MRETEPNETPAHIPEDLYDKRVTGLQVLTDTICLQNVLDTLNGKLEEQKIAMTCHPAACVWLYYIKMINLRKFIKENGQETGFFIYIHSRKCCNVLLLC